MTIADGLMILGAGLGPIEFSTPLGPTMWAALIGVPVGIIALYFLKLRRRPVQVPSTLLWRRSLEDLHVNSLFQRLRRNLLLFLQLLAVLLMMLALLGPRIKGTTGQGQRFVVAIDNSASMRAKDVSPSRLERAKQQALEIIDAMEADDLAMILTFSDRAQVVQSYTSNRSLLRDRIRSIEATQGTTSLREALTVAAGLANPSKQIGEGVVATAVSAPRLAIFTDGGFPDVEGFSVGNLEPEVVVIGPPPKAPEAAVPDRNRVKSKPTSDNVAILALQVGRDEEHPERFQVFGRIHNFRDERVETQAVLLRRDPENPTKPGSLIDAVAMRLEPQSDQSFKFDLDDTGAAELEVRVDVDDALPLDNHAFTVFGNPRQAQVLLVTPGNRYLEDTLRTATTGQLADVSIVSPDDASSDDVRRDIRSGKYDLIIFDRFRPETSPEANTLYFGSLPPGSAYEAAREVENPTILDWDFSHPVLQYIQELNLVLVARAQVVEPPTGSTELISSDKGPLAFIVPRAGYEDLVVTFDLIRGNDWNSNWPLFRSFPLFVLNTLRVLGNPRDTSGNEVHLPGEPVVLRADPLTEELTVTTPQGKTLGPIPRSPQGTFVFNEARTTGIYHARWGEGHSLAFPVNLFDPRESDLATRGVVPEGVTATEADEYKIKIGYTEVKGTSNATPAMKEWWKGIVIALLGLILFEWYIYNRRVYL